MPLNATLIPGDGIGPEVTDAAVKVLAATGVKIDWDVVRAGGEVIGVYGTPMPESVLGSIRKNRLALKGPITTPIAGGFASANVTLRKALDLYACVRPARSLPAVKARYENVDLIVVRENTEGIYSGIEHIVIPGVVESLKIITERASDRIARFAFALARSHGRKKVTAVHKANIMKLADGLFLECCRRVAREFPGIAYEEMIIDNCAMQLVLNPQRLDVMVMENFYGDVISDICAGLVGGTGLVPGANIGEDCAVFEAVHGSAPDIAGQGRANPIATILSGAAMLRHAGESAAADRVNEAVQRVLAQGKSLTPDLGGTASTVQLTEAVTRAMT